MIKEYIRKPEKPIVHKVIRWDGKKETFDLIKKTIDYGESTTTKVVFTCSLNKDGELLISKQEFFGIGATYNRLVTIGEFVVGTEDGGYCAVHNPEDFEDDFLRYYQPKLPKDKELNDLKIELSQLLAIKRNELTTKLRTQPFQQNANVSECPAWAIQVFAEYVLNC